MEKENKYYEKIKELVMQHKKFEGLEPILEEIINDVYSHSEVILNNVNDDNVVNTYLQKIISTSLITVPKNLDFHKGTKKISAIETSSSNTKLVDNLINQSKDEQIKINLISNNGQNEQENVSDNTNTSNSDIINYNKDSDINEININNDIEEIIENEELDTDELEFNTLTMDNENDFVIQNKISEEIDINEELEETKKEDNIGLQDEYKLASNDSEIDISLEDNELDQTNELQEIVTSDDDILELDDTNFNEELDIKDTQDFEDFHSENENSLNIQDDNKDEQQLLEINNNVDSNSQNIQQNKKIDFSIFNFDLNDTSIKEEIDIELITNDLEKLLQKNSSLNIAAVYNLKYKQNKNIDEIAKELNIEETEVLETLNKIIEVI